MSYIGGDLVSGYKELDSISRLSPAAVEIISVVDRKETTIDDIVELVSIDKVLYASLFKYVNSVAFGLRRSLSDLKEALNYLGLQGLRDLIFLLAAKKMFNCSHNWEHSVFVAFTVKKLALRFGLQQKHTSDIYIAALVHDMGSMVLDAKFGTTYQELREEEDLYSRFSMEKGLFGVNSIEISHQILSDCDIPKKILKIIESQALAPDHESYTLENALIDLANRISFMDFHDQIDLDDLMETTVSKRFDLQALNLNLKFIKKICNEVGDFLNN
jgi:HD-like signal output (HDOD) protein